MTPPRRRVLFIAPRYPNPPVRGDQRRVIHLLRGLAQHADVTLLTVGTGPDLELEQVRVRSVTRKPLDALIGNARHPEPGLPLQARLYLSRRLLDLSREELDRDPAVVHLTLARMGPYLPGPWSWHRHVDLVDAASLNMATRARTARPPTGWPFALEAKLLGRYEAALVERADSASLVSEQDRRLAPGLERATVIPNGVDTETFPFQPPDPRPPVLIFFGNLGYFHNIAPARFVAHEVLPRVRAQNPEATLRLVGARPAASIRALARQPGVTLVGPVDRMADELHTAAVAVIPMFSGSGIKNKVLEAFSAGTPVVTNPLGIEGVEGARPGVHYRRAETAEALAGACADLLRTPSERVAMARRARTLVEDSYSWDRQVRALLDVYGDRL